MSRLLDLVGSGALMRLSTRIALGFGLFLCGITMLHGGLNHGWFSNRVRARLVVGHLPVT
ncbi:MAG: hypothetical protein R3F34_06225 [Planctomycetota bacterium]